MARIGGKFLASDFVQEAPSGTINGVNTSFSLSTTPVIGTVMIFLDGVYQRPTTDYTISGTSITMGAAPANGQDLRACFWRRD